MAEERRSTSAEFAAYSSLDMLAWTDAILAVQLFAVAHHALGGICVRARSGPVRDIWLSLLRAALADNVVIRTMPTNVTDDRLLGGLDLVATLAAGRPVAAKGLLAEVDGGVILMPMAERVDRGLAAKVAAAMDHGEALVARDGIAHRFPARFGVVALDEGAEPEEQPPAALVDRLALHVDLTGVPRGYAAAASFDRASLAAARARFQSVLVSDEAITDLCHGAAAVGIESLRAPILAVGVARASAALAGRLSASSDDLETAARLVLGPRAQQMPATAWPPNDDEMENEAKPEDSPSDDAGDARMSDGPLDDVVVEASAAAVPPGLLAALQASSISRKSMTQAGRSPVVGKAANRGRPIGVRRGAMRGGARLDLLATLRAAVPWQRLRRAERDRTGQGLAPAIILIRPDDLFVKRFRQRLSTTMIFCVDASGSSALHRLAEAKGAVSLLLADCYIRRDKVALVTFRGRSAEVLLPPTRSLARAKRQLASLPGGGATPLASGLRCAAELAGVASRAGQSPAIIVMTDGRTNIALDGVAGRKKAEDDALAVAKSFRERRYAAMIVDTAPLPQPFAAALAEAMGARYAPLPLADAQRLTQSIQAMHAG